MIQRYYDMKDILPHLLHVANGLECWVAENLLVGLEVIAKDEQNLFELVHSCQDHAVMKLFCFAAF